MKKLNQLSLKFERHMDIPRIPWESFPVLTFEAVQVVDVSNCPMLHLEAAVECFSKSFPSLTTLKAAYILNFRTMELYQLLQRCPLLSDIDLTVDSTPVIPAKVSVISSFPAVALPISTSSNDETCSDVPAFHFSRKLSNITKFILEGRTDVYGMIFVLLSKLKPHPMTKEKSLSRKSYFIFWLLEMNFFFPRFKCSSHCTWFLVQGHEP